jgi:hypothetical protein
MNELDKFFQTEVKAFDEEIKKIDTVLGDVIPIFANRQVTVCKSKDCLSNTSCSYRNYRQCFVYNLNQCGDISCSNVGKWSSSTNAMMLSLVAYLQERDFTSPFIQGKRSLTLPKEVAEKFRERVDMKQAYRELAACFMTKHNHREKPLDKGFHDSGSYGPNPWSTLAWFGEVMLFMEKAKKKPDENLIKLWCRIVAKKIEKELKKYPKMDHVSGINNMRGAVCYNLLEKFFALLKKYQEDFFEKDKEFKNLRDNTKRHVYENFRPILLNRIYQQLTSFEISDGFFDPGELAFNMEGLVRLDKGHHYYQDNLLERFFKVMTECLHREAFWRTSKPVNQINGQGHISEG